MAALKNARWEKFAQLIASQTPKKEAYGKAGYKASGSGASVLLKKPKVAKRIEELLELAADEAVVDIEWWLAKVVENVERCMQARPVRILDTGADPDEEDDNETIGVYKYNATGANKALELLGKHLGAFKADNDQKPQPGGAVIVQYPANGRD